jgi:integrase
MNYASQTQLCLRKRPFSTLNHYNLLNLGEKPGLASHLVAGNANLALIRQALGHRSIGSTMAYVGTSDSQAAEALQRALMGLF